MDKELQTPKTQGSYGKNVILNGQVGIIMGKTQERNHGRKENRGHYSRKQDIQICINGDLKEGFT